MFAKLLKYEWKSCAGLLGVLSAAALGVGVLGVVILRIMDSAGQRISAGEDAFVMAEIALGAVIAFLMLALVAYVFAVQILLMVRFYKNKFTDEGYLTFTLPVTSHQIFLSSALNYIFWMVISGCVAALAVLIAVVFGTGGEKPINTEIFVALKDMAGDILDIYGYDEVKAARVVVVNVLRGAVNVVYMPVLIMTCITMGATLAKRHKVLMAFGMYYAVNMGIGVVTSAFTVAAEVALYSQSNLDDTAYITYMETISLIQLAIQLAVLVGGYFLSTHLMRKNLNLP